MKNTQQILDDLSQYINTLGASLRKLDQQQREDRSCKKYEVLAIKKIYFDYIKAGATGEEATQLTSEYFNKTYTSIADVVHWGNHNKKKELLQARILAANKLYEKGFTIINIAHILDVSKSTVSRLLKNKTLEQNYF